MSDTTGAAQRINACPPKENTTISRVTGLSGSGLLRFKRYLCSMDERRKAIFLDKDGTIIPDIPYNVNPDLITLNAGVMEGLQLLKSTGYIFVVISNQAGVARGYFKISDLQHVREKLSQLFDAGGIQIENYYFCPHHPDGIVPEYTGKCNCRKPEPGMLLQAIEELNIDAAQSWMIGDILNDVEAGNRAGCRTVLVNNGNETEWIPGSFREPAFVAASFLDAAEFIGNNPHVTSELQNAKLAAL